jgi:hypothetical protein
MTHQNGETFEERAIRFLKGGDGIEALTCDICGKPVGYVYDFDLQGNYFYCAECVALHNPQMVKP